MVIRCAIDFPGDLIYYGLYFALVRETCTEATLLISDTNQGEG